MRKPDHPEPQSIDMLRKLGYESSDVSLPVLVKWIAGLFIFIGGTSILTWGIYLIFVPSVPVDQSTGKTVNKLAPGIPALQTHPKVDMRVFREEEEKRYDSYGWVDKARGVVHVPVEEALQKIAAAGVLPKAEPGAGNVPPARGEDVRPNPATPGGGASQGPAGGATVPGMPNAAVPGAQTEGSLGPQNLDMQSQSGAVAPPPNTLTSPTEGRLGGRPGRR